MCWDAFISRNVTGKYVTVESLKCGWLTIYPAWLWLCVAYGHKPSAQKDGARKRTQGIGHNKGCTAFTGNLKLFVLFGEISAPSSAHLGEPWSYQTKRDPRNLHEMWLTRPLQLFWIIITRSTGLESDDLENPHNRVKLSPTWGAEALL